MSFVTLLFCLLICRGDGSWFPFSVGGCHPCQLHAPEMLVRWSDSSFAAPLLQPWNVFLVSDGQVETTIGMDFQTKTMQLLNGSPDAQFRVRHCAASGWCQFLGSLATRLDLEPLYASNVLGGGGGTCFSNKQAKLFAGTKFGLGCLLGSFCCPFGFLLSKFNIATSDHLSRSFGVRKAVGLSDKSPLCAEPKQ